MCQSTCKTKEKGDSGGGGAEASDTKTVQRAIVVTVAKLFLATSATQYFVTCSSPKYRNCDLSVLDASTLLNYIDDKDYQ